MKFSMRQKRIKGEGRATGFFVLLMPFLYTLYLILSTPSAHAGIKPPPSSLGLVGYWSMDDCRGASSTDLSGQGNTGTLTNFALSGTTSNWVTGNSAKRGCALNFDGTNDRVTASSLKIPSGDMTISTWVNVSSTTGTRDIISDSDGGYVELRSTDGGTGRFSFDTNGGIGITSSAYPTGSWHHVVAVVSSTTKYLYVDGVQVSTGATVIHTQSAAGVNIGSLSGTSQFFSGSLDEVRIYNRALSATEVTALYNAGATKLLGAGSDKSAGLVGHWKLDDGAGTSAVDSSGQGNTGTLTNFALSGVTSTWTSGYRAGALNFDGTNDTVIFSGISVGTTHTYSAWIKPNSQSASYGSLFGSTAGGTGYFYRGSAAGADAGKITYWIGADRLTSVALNDQQWNHFAASVTGGAISFYINGVAAGTQTAGAAFTAVGMGSSGGFVFNGSLDDVRLYNRALSAEEVKTLYSSGTTRPTIVNAGSNKLTAGTNLASGLVGHWTFDGQYLNTTTSTDTSGQGNNGTLTNGPVPVLGKLGQALSFDGTNDYVDFGTSNSLNVNTALTIGLWFKKTGTAGGATGYHALIQRFGAGPTGYQLYINNSDSIVRFYTNTVVASTYTLSDSNWHYYSVTNDGATTRFYVDGVAYGTASQTVPSVTSATTNNIGAYSSNGFTNGSLDDVRIYNRALSAGEVSQLYNLGR